MPVIFSGLIGIDLGTTFSCVAHLTGDGMPTTIPNREGDLVTPSVVLIEEDGAIVVGREAKRSECLFPDRTAVCVKRDMGNPQYSRPVGGVMYRPEVLSAMILKRLKEDAERKLGVVQHAVITVPAYFDDTRRKATQDAGLIAGLHVLDILNEPTAAALAYTFESHVRKHGQAATFADQFARRELTVLVYDLGGGTFDVSLVKMSHDRFETLATDGDVRLGGRDWDERIVNYVSEEFLREKRSDPRTDAESLAALYQSVEQAKHALSVRANTRILVIHDAQRMSVDLSREQFDRLTQSLLTRTQMTTELVVESAGLTWSEIDRVLLVGGMTRLPQVRDMLKKLTGRDPDVSVAPDEVVAHGAAIHGGILLSRAQGSGPNSSGPVKSWASFQTIDVNSHSLGIAVRAADGGYANSILIPKNTQLPVARSRTYHTSVPNQRQVRVRILEGEAREAEACVQIGEFLIQGLPPNLPERAPIEVECRYAADGRISVVGRDPTSGQLAETTIIRQGGIEDKALHREAKKLATTEIQ